MVCKVGVARTLEHPPEDHEVGVLVVDDEDAAFSVDIRGGGVVAALDDVLTVVLR